jgi:septal ring factor EnvC (AmiA/AmiB activator)
MWRKLVELARQVVSLYSQMKRQAERTNELAEEVEFLRADVKELSARVGRIEILLEEREKREATERENLRLQLENLLLRYQRRLPPSGKTQPEEEPEE